MRKKNRKEITSKNLNKNGIKNKKHEKIDINKKLFFYFLKCKLKKYYNKKRKKNVKRNKKL